MSNYFFLQTPAEASDLVTLSPEESHHAVKVLRLKEDSPMSLLDGKGNIYQGILTDSDPRSCQIRITQKTFIPPRPYHLHMAVAPVKNMDRYEWFVEKAVEIGIDEITPILSENSQKKSIHRERLEKLIHSAMKQSCQAYKTILHPETEFRDFFSIPRSPVFLGHCYPGQKKPLKQLCDNIKKAVFVIGPEGDFSPSEVEFARQQGALEMTLGHQRLRTETAALLACSSMAILKLS